MPRALTLVLLVGLVVYGLSAGSPGGLEPRWELIGPQGPVRPGEPFEVTARVSLPEGYYQDAGSDFLVFEPGSPATVSLRTHSLPTDRAGKASFTRSFTLHRTLVLSPQTPGGNLDLGFTLGWQICQVDGVCLLPAQRSAVLALKVDAQSAPASLFWAFLAAAFLGGLLLNVMPCVFPVLALKVVGLASTVGQTNRGRRTEALAFAAGTFGTLVALGLVTAAAAAWGQRLDWGFTFQSPVFVAVLTVAFWAFALQLLGVWRWSWSPFRLVHPVRISDGSRPGAPGVLRSLAGGAFLVLAAAPCTAPLLGPALGFAFAQPPGTIPLFFGAAGLGLALPLVLVSLVPGWSKVVPRPGPWMTVVERIAGGALAITVVYLVWIFTRLTRDDWLVPSVVVLAAIAGGLAVPQRWAPTLRWLARGTLALVVAGTVGITAALPAQPPAEAPLPAGWVRFSLAGLDEARTQGRLVLVDATAAWCATCQVNEAAVLLRTDVAKLLESRGIVRMRADYTRPDPEIQRWLTLVGRAGLPVSVLYRPGQPPTFFPELLTDDNFTRRIEATTPTAATFP